MALGLVFAPAGAAGRIPARAATPTADFEAASNDEAKAIAAVTVARARRADLESRARDLDAQVARADAASRARAADLDRLNRAKQALEARVVKSQAQLEVARRRSGRNAALLYRQAGASAPPALAALGGARSIRDASVASRYLSNVGERVAADLDAVRIAHLDVIDAQHALKLRRHTVIEAAQAAATEAANLRAVQGTERQAVDDARQVEIHLAAVLAGAQARKAEFERAAAANRAASNGITDVLHGRPAGGNALRRFRFPADGPITSPFGERMHPIFHTMRMHTGIDIGAGYGSPVRAGGDGVVVIAGPASGYGNAIVVDHGGGIATLYGHLSRFGVRQGQRVTAGQTIGAVGNTGNSTGPHLHFEVRVQGVPVDPMPYL